VFGCICTYIGGKKGAGKGAGTNRSLVKHPLAPEYIGGGAGRSEESTSVWIKV